MKIMINENIARLRKRAGISQEELANTLKVSNQAVSKWECGMCCPDIELLPEIAHYFCVSVDELLMGETSINLNSASDEKYSLVLQALEIVRENHKINPALLQRKLNIGYSTAKNIIDDMDKAGLIEQSIIPARNECI